MFKVGDKVRLRVEAQLPGGSARIAKHTEGVVMVVGQYGVTSLVTVQIQFLLADCDSSILEPIQADAPAPVEPPKVDPPAVEADSIDVGDVVARVSGTWPNLPILWRSKFGQVVGLRNDGRTCRVSVGPYLVTVELKDVRKVTP